MAVTRNKIAALLVLALFISSCSNTRRLPEGDSLFLGSKVDIKDPEQTPKRERKILPGDLEGAIRPKPNSTLLGVRLKLSLYTLAGDTSKKNFIRNALRSTGEPPVLASYFDSVTNHNLLTNILENKGYFYPSISSELKTRRRKTRARFDITTGYQYKIRNIIWPSDSSQVSKDISAQRNESLLRIDAPYNLDLIKGEFERIDKKLKEIGYYYFSPNYLITRVDSTVGDHKVDIYIKTEADMPPIAREIYTINKVFIYPNHRLGTRNRRRVDTTNRGRNRNNDTLFYERYYIVGNTKAYEPFVFTQAMQFHPGDLYNRTDQNISLNRLINMGIFKFVKNEFDDLGNNELNAFYYLTPYPKKSLRFEIGGYTKNDSRVGTEGSVSWRNRNTFKGAELFTFKVSGGLEQQFGGNVKRPGLYTFGVEPSFTIPRFVIPWWDPQTSSIYVPRTRIIAGYDMEIRDTLYALQSFRASYGYEWKPGIREEHQLYPINVTSVNTDTLSPNAEDYINYSNLTFEGLIIGPTYSYTYSTRIADLVRHDDYYFNGLVDLSGNILGLAQGAKLSDAQAGNPKKIFNSAYAQYVKLQTDFRFYLNYGADKNSIWANRLLLGIGIPYGNSVSLPNVKQFFSGGNSSLRGFPSRLVGPGTFNFRDVDTQYIQTSGDLKLELNTEARAKLYSFLHGALFVDAGNVWTMRDTTLFGPGAKFSGKFLSELAVNIGAGIRFDFKILVLRLDLGIPVRKPWLPPEQRWDLAFNLGSSQWRKENLIFNIAIGYPF
jgi:outer membrane protein insertion porin family